METNNLYVGARARERARERERESERARERESERARERERQRQRQRERESSGERKKERGSKPDSRLCLGSSRGTGSSPTALGAMAAPKTCKKDAKKEKDDDEEELKFVEKLFDQTKDQLLELREKMAEARKRREKRLEKEHQEEDAPIGAQLRDRRRCQPERFARHGQCGGQLRHGSSCDRAARERRDAAEGQRSPLQDGVRRGAARRRKGRGHQHFAGRPRGHDPAEGPGFTAYSCLEHFAFLQGTGGLLVPKGSAFAKEADEALRKLAWKHKRLRMERKDGSGFCGQP